MKPIRQGLFAEAPLPGTPGNFHRVKRTEEELAEATSCPISAEGKCCNITCAAFKAEVSERDNAGQPAALRFFCEGKPPTRLAIGVVKGLRRAAP